jgi:hypothetical protein
MSHTPHSLTVVVLQAIENPKAAFSNREFSRGRPTVFLKVYFAH